MTDAHDRARWSTRSSTRSAIPTGRLIERREAYALDIER